MKVTTVTLKIEEDCVTVSKTQSYYKGNVKVFAQIKENVPNTTEIKNLPAFVEYLDQQLNSALFGDK